MHILEQEFPEFFQNCYCGCYPPDGWIPLLRDLCNRLRALSEPVEVHQVKEKFGELRFYTGSISEAAGLLIREAENASCSICEVCSSPGELRPGGWVRTLCDGHYIVSKQV